MELSISILLKGISLLAYSFVGIFTTVTLLMIGLLIVIVIIPIRQVVNILFSYKYKNRFKIMEPMDADLCKDTGPSSMMITACFLAQLKFGPENLEKLRSKLYSKIVINSSVSENYKKLQFVPCKKLGFRCWEDVQFLGGFDIQSHVKLCPGGEDWSRVYSETELLSLLNKAVNQKPVENKPKWEILVVPQVRTKTSASQVAQTQVAVIIRTCHAYMDGNHFVKFIQTCIFDDEQESKIAVQALSKRTNWKFSRIAIFYLKMFVFGALDSMIIRFGEGFKTTRIFQEGIATENSGHSFIGNIKVESEPVRKIQNEAKCKTVAAVFGTAFLRAMGTFAEQRNVGPHTSVNVALTKVIPAGASLLNDLTQNRFAVYGRNLPVPMMTQPSKDIMKRMLTTTNDLIHLTPDNEYETIASFYMSHLAGILPDVGIRAIISLFNFYFCLISVTPMSDQIFWFQGGLVTSFFGGPPYAYGTCYSLGISNYGGDFYATLIVEKSSLIQSQYEFQELLSHFEESMTHLQKITC